MPACLRAVWCDDIDVPDGVEAAWLAKLRRTRHVRRADHCCDDVRFSVVRGCRGSLSPRRRTGLRICQGQTQANQTSQIAESPDGRLPCRCAGVTGSGRSSWLVVAAAAYTCPSPHKRVISRTGLRCRLSTPWPIGPHGFRSPHAKQSKTRIVLYVR